MLSSVPDQLQLRRLRQLIFLYFLNFSSKLITIIIFLLFELNNIRKIICIPYVPTQYTMPKSVPIDLYILFDGSNPNGFIHDAFKEEIKTFLESRTNNKN